MGHSRGITDAARYYTFAPQPPALFVGVFANDECRRRFSSVDRRVTVDRNVAAHGSQRGGQASQLRSQRLGSARRRTRRRAALEISSRGAHALEGRRAWTVLWSS